MSPGVGEGTLTMTLVIAVGVDGSDPSDAALRWAAREAALHAAPLKLLHVVTPPNMVAWQEPLAMTGYGEWQQTRAREILDKGRQLAEEAAPGVEVSTESLAGPSVATLIDLSKDAQMMVVGCRGLGAVGRALLGSVSRALVHHAHCPVAVVHDATAPDDAPVVVGIDGSPASERAVAMAFDEASCRGVGLVAVHAWSDAGVMDFPGFDFTPLEQDANEVLAERLAGWQERYPDVAVERIVAFDRPVPQLLLQAKRAQLLVVGSHGRGGFAGMLLGSVSSAVVQSATVPVLVARQA
jgi:nucleotide-binding universal stress UspA family protein